MKFLYLDVSTKQVMCSPEGFTRPEVQKLHLADKTKDKSHFNAVITGIYFIYTPRGIYWNKSLSDRTKITNSDHLTVFGTTWEKLSKDQNVKALVDCFIDLSTTINDRADQNLRNDFDALIEALNNVPTTIAEEIPANVEFLCEDGKIHKSKKPIKIIIPNFETKGELWNHFKTFSKNLKEIQANLKQEEAERIKDGSEDVFLYDTPEKNK